MLPTVAPSSLTKIPTPPTLIVPVFSMAPPTLAGTVLTPAPPSTPLTRTPLPGPEMLPLLRMSPVTDPATTLIALLELSDTVMSPLLTMLPVRVTPMVTAMSSKPVRPVITPPAALVTLPE